MYENYHVLFVDDEENVLASIKRGLMDEEYTCHFATSGQMALELMEKQEFAVIVSDMKMPNMDGLKLLKEVRQKWPKCVRIVLSGYTQLPQIILSINQADIFRFITKPWHLEEDLIDTIRKALDYYILAEDNEKNKQKLEKRNQLYFKLLHTLENQTKHYKQGVEFLTLLAKASIAFGEDLNNAEKEAYQDILEFRKELLGLFSSAAMANRQSFQSEELANLLSNFISNQFKITYVKRHDIKEAELSVFYEMLKATIIATKAVLRPEVDRYGISARVGFNQDGVFSVFLLTMFDNNSLESENLFRKKLLYLSELLGNLSAFGLECTLTENESTILLKIELIPASLSSTIGNG